MRHVVIGGGGFTGGWLVQDLRRDDCEVLVCDVQGQPEVEQAGASFLRVDVTDDKSVATLPLTSDDIVYMLAARQYHLAVPRRGRGDFFEAVNLEGLRLVLEHMRRCGCHRMVYFSTDMVYGIPKAIPVGVDHERNPLGEYGLSKKKSEDLVFEYRKQGMNITIFRPRLIIGPGRLGVLTRLFDAILKNLPVPLIGNGSNSYQMVSVFDCVSAIRCAVAKGIPNGQYNLGSDNPPSVHRLLGQLIREKGSRSALIKTPGGLVKLVLAGLDKLGLTVLYREQFAIADIDYLVDIERTKSELDWKPMHSDQQMIQAAFDEYVSGGTSQAMLRRVTTSSKSAP